MNEKFGRFFRYAFYHWKKPIIEDWKKVGLWSLLASALSFVILLFWVGEHEMTIEVKVFIALIGGTAIAQIIRYLWIAINSPFTIIKEQDGIIYAYEKTQDRESMLLRLRELRKIGVELRNKGKTLLHQRSIDSWWIEFADWKKETSDTISLLDKERAEKWKTLDNYTPKLILQKPLTPDHGAKYAMFSEWIDRLDKLTDDLKLKLP